MAHNKLRAAFTNPVSGNFLPGATMVDNDVVSERTLQRWAALGYVEKRGMYVLTSKGWRAGLAATK